MIGSAHIVKIPFSVGLLVITVDEFVETFVKKNIQ
jgi:hypothetical protein